MPPYLLAEPEATASEAPSNRPPPHSATRITRCGHIVGKECLLAWLDISCACPVCNCPLFDATDEEITERDVAFVYKKLRWLWRKWEIFAAIERVLWRKRYEQGWREERAPGVDPVVEERVEGEFWDGEMGEEEGSEEGEIVERVEMDEEDEEMEDGDEGYDNEGYDAENEDEGDDDVGSSEDMDISDSSE